jgi:SAM-dependent methyltransferase
MRSKPLSPPTKQKEFGMGDYTNLMSPDQNRPDRKQSQPKRFEFVIQNERPEEICGDPLKFYTKDQVQQYAQSKALMRIQEKITIRVLNLAELSAPATILDIGMGCGFSTSTALLNGFRMVGFDLNRLFLTFYPIAELNPIHADARYVPFRQRQFDAVISISAIQWIIAEKVPAIRKAHLEFFARNALEVVRPGGKVILQFYPKSDEIMRYVGSIFDATGMCEGGFVIDNPEIPKKRKIYLVVTRTAGMTADVAE